MRKYTVVLICLLAVLTFFGCGEKTSEPNACQHDYYLSDYIPPTETNNGHNIYTCKNCGNTYSEVIPATGKTAGTGSTTNPNDSVEEKQQNSPSSNVIDLSRYSSKTDLLSLKIYSKSSTVYNFDYAAEALDAAGYKHEDVYTAYSSNDYYRYELMLASVAISQSGSVKNRQFWSAD